MINKKQFSKELITMLDTKVQSRGGGGLKGIPMMLTIPGLT